MITDIILDFDGTCTQIPLLFETFLATYFTSFQSQMSAMNQPITQEDWADALHQVQKKSPEIGWTLGVCPSAPAAADPYIWAGEAANHILRSRQNTASPDAKIFVAAYAAAQPQWRTDAAGTFIVLQNKGINLHFISNSSTATIQGLLKDKAVADVGPIPVLGNAAKFNIRELTWDPLAGNAISDKAKKMFEAIPVSCNSPLVNIERPVYLRRGSFFESIYKALDGNMDKLKTTLFCGDVWELDLAMPYELGANIHLIKRAEPFNTYPYEINMVESYGERGKISEDLSGLLAWF